MADYLLVHGAGQGAWSWGPVWGYLTAPLEHPPRLHIPRCANRVYPLDLPGHGANTSRGSAARVSLEECVQAIVGAVEHEELSDVVLVGHGFAGILVLQAAQQLRPPPRRVVLIAGIVPDRERSMLSAFPSRTRKAYQLLRALGKVTRQDLGLPRWVITRYLCNGIDPMEVVHILGSFGPLPTRVVTTRLKAPNLSEVSALGPKAPCPVTYVVLTQDRVLPPHIQRRMAGRIPDVETLQLDSCHQVTLAKPRELADLLLSYA